MRLTSDQQRLADGLPTHNEQMAMEKLARRMAKAYQTWRLELTRMQELGEELNRKLNAPSYDLKRLLTENTEICSGVALLWLATEVEGVLPETDVIDMPGYVKMDIEGMAARAPE
jgi:hypothetical protein